MYVSENLKKIIKDKNISYGELSKITGIPKTTIQRYAVGTTKKIPIDAIQKLELALNDKISSTLDDLDSETLNIIHSLKSNSKLKSLFTILSQATDNDITRIMEETKKLQIHNR